MIGETKIAIIGASYLQMPLIEKAKDMGLETHVFAWQVGDVGEFAAHYFHPVSIVEKDEILRLCKEIRIDGICSIASDLAMVTVNYVASKMGLVGNSMDCTMQTTNKRLMREALTDNGDPSPKSMIVKSPHADLLNSLALPLVVKPTDRSGSRGVTKVSHINELGEAILHAIEQSFEKQAVLEEFLEGQEFSVECISCRGVHKMLAITEKCTTGAPHFIEVAHLEPARLPGSVSNDEVEDVVFHALNSLGVENGASHTEIMIDDDRISIVEVGARMGGDCIGSHLVSLSTGFDYVEAVIRVALGQQPQEFLADERCHALIRYLLSSEDQAFLEYVRSDDSVSVVYERELLVEKFPVVDSSKRPGCFIVTADTFSALEGYSGFCSSQ